MEGDWFGASCDARHGRTGTHCVILSGVAKADSGVNTQLQKHAFVVRVSCVL